MTDKLTAGVAASAHQAHDSTGALVGTSFGESGRQPLLATPTSFRAVNVRAVPENTARSTPPTAQRGGNPAVAPGAMPNAQTSSANHDMTEDFMAELATHATRTRQRHSNGRPNYAEDQDMEVDPARTATSRKKAPGGGSALSTQSNHLTAQTDDIPRLKSVNGLVAGTSTPGSTVSAASSSKKRKAAGALPQHLQTPPVSTPLAAVASRKPQTSMPSQISRETNMMTFTKHKSCLNKKGELVADDGTKLSVNDHVYLVCEPPGEPYYLSRIMEFLHMDSENPNSPVDSLRVNWYYRPRDVQRFNSDTRLAYGTMHSDMCPITSLRGKCTIKHRSEIEDLDMYRKERDSFYFVQVYDRFIKRWYECIPVNQIINVPDKVKKALDERWKFVVVEIGRVKELTSAVKTCKRCTRYCASQDSVDCAICKNSYHMNCVQPPLPKKPSRGFAWACGPCGRATERKLEARNTPTTGDVTEAEEELVEGDGQLEVFNDSTQAPSPEDESMGIDEHPATLAEMALAKMWPMRYLGIHCRVEDALHYDDRAIYPRASSRLGPRHQANMNMWHGRPVELVKPAEIKKRYNKSSNSHKKDGKLTKETIAALEADREEKAKRPKWVQDEPPGYVPRGEDYPENDPRCTAKLMYRMPERGEPAEKAMFVDDFVKRAKQYARAIGVPPFGVNFLDKALELLIANNYVVDVAIRKLQQVDRKKDLHEPVLTKNDLQKFEEGVAKYGSEHRLIRLHMKTNLPNADIVRFYYLWKKTPKGKEIWGNYGGRKGSKRKVESEAGARLQAEVAHDRDDSAFDNDKAARRNRGFQCKFCHTAHSRQWRRAPGVSAGQTAIADGKNGSKDKKEKPLLALCLRCAGLWRKYAIQWEDVDEVAKKVAQGGGRAIKRRIDEELLRELVAANEAASMSVEEPQLAMPSIEVPNGEPPKKRSKTDTVAAAAVLPPEPPKKKEKPPPPPKEPTPPPPPIIPNQPQWKALACAVCKGFENTIACAHCKLTVHRRCFGVGENEGVRADGSVNWVCEQCSNDRYPEVSTDYACCLCLTEETLVDLVEPPKVSHKKKTDREREKERMEKELADNMRIDYRTKQVALNRPMIPREPLKKTTGNNWVHMHCAVWTPEIRFSNALKMEVAEGFQFISSARYEAVCKLCKNKDIDNKLREDAGACVSCFQCSANFHASCALEAGYQFGFDVTPVKGSRKDQVTTAKLGEESGSVIPAIWCKEHVVKSIVHPMTEIVDETGKLALQVYVETYKQADLTLTGTVRKANLVQLTKEKAQQATTAAANNARRESTANSIAAAVKRGARTSSAAETKLETEDVSVLATESSDMQSVRRCVKCKYDVTPRWHPVIREQLPKEPTPLPPRRLSMTLGEIADLERQRSQAASRTNGGAESSGEVTDNPPLSGPLEPQQNIRFMAPGASGRAWDGMPERAAARPAISDETLPREQSPAVVVSKEPVDESNGEQNAPPVEETTSEEGFHTHALPRYQNPATTPPPAEKEEAVVDEWLCHKCFIKKKIDPTPSPPPQTGPPELSPTRPFTSQLDWHRPSVPPAPQPPQNGAGRMPWDDPPRQSQPPPTHINGVGPAPPPYGVLPAAQGSGYPPYGAPPNGFHGPPPQPHHGQPVGPPPIHDRQPSFGYGPPPPPNPDFPPHNQSLVNGMHSPLNGHPQLHSPTYPPGPPQQYPQHQQPFPPRNTAPISTQLPGFGQPYHHRETQHSLAANMVNGQAPTPTPAHASPQPGFVRHESFNGGQQQQINPGTMMQHPSPQPGFVRHEMYNGQHQQQSSVGSVPQHATSHPGYAEQNFFGEHQQQQAVLGTGSMAQQPNPQPMYADYANEQQQHQQALPGSVPQHVGSAPVYYESFDGQQQAHQSTTDPTLANTSPQVAHNWIDSTIGDRPTTPRAGQQGNGAGPIGGASASPNLRNLLH